MNHSKTEQPFKMLEIAISVQERLLGAEGTEILHRFDGKLFATSLKNLEPAKFAQDACR